MEIDGNNTMLEFLCPHTSLPEISGKYLNLQTPGILDFEEGPIGPPLDDIVHLRANHYVKLLDKG